MRYRIIFLSILSMLSISACNLGTNDSSDPIDNNPDIEVPTEAPGRPIVTIVSPATGGEVLVNDPVLISFNASDTVGVTSVQLAANGVVVRTVSSERSTGDTSGSYLLDYTPTTAGSLQLTVTARRGSVESEPATLSLTVRGSQQQIIATSQQTGPVINPNDPTCRALINIGLNFRRGPSTDFEVIRVLGAGEIIPITGRLSNNSWWQLSSGSNIGWVDARFITAYGNCTTIAAVSPPASATPNVSPTPAPTSAPATATTVPTLAATATPQTPNLIITNVSGPDEVTIPDGATSVTVRYSVNITNQGGPVQGQFSNTVRLIPGGDEFDLGVVAALGAGQSISLDVNITFDEAGAFILQFKADSDNDITESNEVDNNVVYDVEITAG